MRTERVLLEGAYFTPMAIARTAIRLGLRTEASVRFERGCDPLGIDRAMLRLCEVLGQSAGAEFRVVRGSIDVRGDVPERSHVRLRTSRLDAVLGTTLDDSEIAGYLDPIGFEAKVSDPGILAVTVPSFRPDSTREIDVIEEVARHYGYGSIPRRTPRPSQVGLLSETQRQRRKLRNVLSQTGAHEAWTPSLIAPGDHERVGLAGADIVIANPLNPEESVLRRSFLPGMLRALALNLNRRLAGVRFFEIGNVFPVPDAARVASAMTHADPAQTVVRRARAGRVAARWPA